MVSRCLSFIVHFLTTFPVDFTPPKLLISNKHRCESSRQGAPQAVSPGALQAMRQGTLQSIWQEGLQSVRQGGLQSVSPGALQSVRQGALLSKMQLEGIKDKASQRAGELAPRRNKRTENRTGTNTEGQGALHPADHTSLLQGLWPPALRPAGSSYHKPTLEI